MSEFDGNSLREIMRHVATPVTVVTFMDGEHPRGVTIGSFVSVSLDPPLIAFNVNHGTTAHAALKVADRLVVNVLSEEQAFLANQFALSDVTSDEQFEPVPIGEVVGRIPVLKDAAAALECVVEAHHDAGDSSIIVARVTGGYAAMDSRPLLYYDRSYREVGQEREPNLFAPVKRPSSSIP